MKKYLPILLTLFAIINIQSQKLEYKEFTKADIGYKYLSYLSKDSIFFVKNDFLKIGKPSSISFKNILIFQGMGYLPMSVSEHHLLDSNCKIVSISLKGSKRKGFIVYIQIENTVGNFFSINIEQAIDSEEIVFGLSENEALELLKKEKNKLELGIITKEEFEARKIKILNKIKG